jgi:hypothetical protein
MDKQSKQHKQSAKTAKKFFRSLVKLKKKYPMVYVEVWTPEDFDSEMGREFNKPTTDWNDKKWVEVSESLDDQFDANHGTSWFLISDTLDALKIDNDRDSDSNNGETK